MLETQKFFDQRLKRTETSEVFYYKPLTVSSVSTKSLTFGILLKATVPCLPPLPVLSAGRKVGGQWGGDAYPSNRFTYEFNPQGCSPSPMMGKLAKFYRIGRISIVNLDRMA